MRREFVTTEELMGNLRQRGVEELAKVRRAYMESDGQLSFIVTPGEPHQRAPRKQRV